MVKKLFDRSEKELVLWLFDDVFIALGALRYLFDASIGFHSKGWIFDVWMHLDRTLLGLNPNQKPGDIDILLVPRIGDDRFAERTIAVEVKKGVIPKNDRGKSPNSFGLEQSQGLIHDGFPVVGVLHLVFVEDSDRSKLNWIELHETGIHKIGESTQIGHVLSDPGFDEVRNRNIGRLKGLFEETDISYNLQAFTVDRTGLQVVGRSESSGKSAVINKKRKSSLIARIKKLTIPPDLRMIFHYGGLDIEWRDQFLEPSPRDVKV